MAIRYKGLRKWLNAPKLFKDQYFIEDFAEVVLYLIDPAHPLSKSNYQPQRLIRPAELSKRTVKVSLIATVLNEERNVIEWISSVFNQTRLPDEIVITDAGSSDNTVTLLQKFANQSPIPFLIITEPGANIARGRNIAIAASKHDIIVTTDFGCRLHNDWLEKLIVPFEVNPEIQVVGGMYRAVDEDGNEVKRTGWWSNETITNPKDFLPSARSSAFTRDIWKTIGGYPEWLSLTGEDTYFALELRKYASKWAFVPEAVVDWLAPKSKFMYWKKLYTWSKGDGESGIHGLQYWSLTLQALVPIGLSLFFLLLVLSLLIFEWLIPTPLWISISVLFWVLLMWILATQLHVPLNRFLDEAGALYARVLGFIIGSQNRKSIEVARAALIQGTIFILSGVPIDDTGGGARCTQIALEFLRKKYAVVFINRFPKYETVELNLPIQDANLFTIQISKWDWERFFQDNNWLLHTKLLASIVEMPIPEFIPIIQKLRSYNAIVAYDLLDEWNTTLGGEWYIEEKELEIIRESQVLLATAPVLANRLHQISGRNVHLLPNAVNTRLFNPHYYHAFPRDFPQGEWSAIYIGALWGEWFDWNLLSTVATEYPDAAIIVVGDYHRQCVNCPENVFFLGLKPQRDLPAYLANADVAIIPWKVNQITQATSPLKVYEYLAMQKPVVAPALNPLQGIPGVYLANNAQDFVELVGRVRCASLPLYDIEQFIANNNWQKRVDDLIDLFYRTSLRNGIPNRELQLPTQG